MEQQPLHYLTASEIVAGIANGNLDSTQVTQGLAKRIERLEPKLHSYFTVIGSAAMDTLPSWFRIRAGTRFSSPASGRLSGAPNHVG